MRVCSDRRFNLDDRFYDDLNYLMFSLSNV
jgi:hypothetical protein